MVKVILVAATLWEHSCFYLLYFFLDLEQVSSDKFVGFLFGENDEDFFLVWQSLSYKRSVCWFNRNTKTEYTGVYIIPTPNCIEDWSVILPPYSKVFFKHCLLSYFGILAINLVGSYTFSKTLMNVGYEKASSCHDNWPTIH